MSGRRSTDAQSPRIPFGTTLLETERYLATDYTLYKDSQDRMEQSIGHIFPEVDFE